MTDFLDLPTLVIIAVAIFILLRLRSVLGTRTGNERQPQDPFRPRNDAGRREREDTVVPMRPAEPAPKTEDAERRARKMEAEIERFSNGDADVARGLKAIAEADAGFSPKSFLDGAKSAYEMIVTAFAAGDRKTLKTLLEKDVYDGFESVIAEREQKGQTVDFTFVGLPLIEISGAELDRKTAQVTIHFKAEVVSATKDSSGQLIEGNDEQVTTIADAWTFARNVRSRDPNWKLVATDQLD